MAEEDLDALVYQKLLLRPEGLSVEALSTILTIDHRKVAGIVDALIMRGVVQYDRSIVVPVRWEDRDHVELHLNVPRLSPESFLHYCHDLDHVAADLRRKGVDSIRPFSHETTLAIMLGAAAGFALAELAKGLLGELGKTLAAFVTRSTRNHREAGLTSVEIKGVVRSLSSEPVIFSVTGQDEESVVKRFNEVAAALRGLRPGNLGASVTSGDGWEIIVKSS